MLSSEVETVIHALEAETRTMQRQQLLKQLWRLDHRKQDLNEAQETPKEGEASECSVA